MVEENKRRLIQERDRLGLWLVGSNRVVRESSLVRVLFPGRDQSTARNRIAELARDQAPVGAYWRAYRRHRDDGTVERYFGLTELGYQQGSQVSGGGYFERRPVDPLKPSHVEHDLELADFALSLFPTRVERHQPMVRGRAVGPAMPVETVLVPKRWTWRHASVFRRLTVLGGGRLSSGEWAGRPKVVCAFEPDAVLETHSWNCTRYFIEWDRGTEPIKGREKRTIEDKLRRILEYLWLPPSELEVGAHWSERSSYYLRAFRGRDRLRPKVLLVTSSAVRARNMTRLAQQMFRGHGQEALSLLEIVTVEQAREKLHRVLQNVEGSPEPDEMPWVAELRSRDAAATSEASRRARASRLAELRDPLYVPRAPAADAAGAPKELQLEATETQALVAWADELGASLRPPWQRTPLGPSSQVEVMRAHLQSPLVDRLGAALGLVGQKKELFAMTRGECRSLIVDFDREISRRHDDGALHTRVAVAALRVLGTLLVRIREASGSFPRTIAAAREAWGDSPDSPWADVEMELRQLEAGSGG